MCAQLMSPPASKLLRFFANPFSASGAETPLPPMVDVHCHILPGVDDGARDWDVTYEMCKLAQADGITHIVASPHANDYYPYDREQHARSLDHLRDKMPDLQFSLGCDFNCSFDNVKDAMERPQRYAIGATNYILVEFSDFTPPAQMMGIVGALNSVGLTSIITHPERLPIITQFPDFPADLVEMGALIQITGNALTGRWGKNVQKTAERLLKNGIVSIIATDAHDFERRRPILSEARAAAARFVGYAHADLLVSENPRRVVMNEVVEMPGAHL